MREHTDRYQVKTWKDMQEILKSFMWIALLDEQPGKQMYDLLHLDKRKVDLSSDRYIGDAAPTADNVRKHIRT